MFPSVIVDLISKASPILGTFLGGPLGSVVGSLISSILGGVDMQDAHKVTQVLQDPAAIQKLKSFELQLTDLQNARAQDSNEKGLYKLIRPLLALAAMFAIMFDVYAIEFVKNEVVKDVLVIMLVILVYDIRQIYKFYFGSSDDLPDLSFLKKKK